MFFIKINKTKLEEWKVIKQYTVLETGALIEVFQNAELINIDNTTKQGTEKYLQTVCLLTPFFIPPTPFYIFGNQNTGMTPHSQIIGSNTL